MNKPTDFLEVISDYVFTTKYARYDEKKQRRETWTECVTRSAQMHHDKFKNTLSKEDLEQIKNAFRLVKSKRIVPSMRCMQFAGKAIEAHNARGYNCAVRPIDSIRSFAEVFYLLLCGCGVGLGVSKTFIKHLPPLVGADDKTGAVINYIVDDSIEGWSDSIEALLNCYFRNTAYTGRKIVFDYSKIRPEGAPVVTGGGKAPGYKGLKRCHTLVKDLLDHIIEDLTQDKMHPINAYDILMHCSDAVLSGGIRRSATIALFDPDDDEMMSAKTFYTINKHTKFYLDEDTNLWCGKVTINGKKYEANISEFEKDQILSDKTISWIHIQPQRARSNNSVLLLRNDTTFEFFKSIIEKTKQFGEPGFAFVDSLDQMYNPCVEIGFLPVTSYGVTGAQFCNLTSCNGALITTKEEFYECVIGATIIGTLQASYTDFPYLSQAAKELTEEESLLGVSITGIFDNPDILLDKELEEEAAELVVDTNRIWAAKLGIPQAARCTCVKPEGTSSLILKSGSGIHAWHNHEFFRRVQCNKLDNVYKFFNKHNPHMCEESVWSANKTDDVITFPITAPPNAKVKKDITAIQHLRLIKRVQQNWVIPGTTESNTRKVTHNVSCTVIVKDDEWDKVLHYLYNNRKFFGAVALLPYIGDKLFKQAPNESIITDEDKEKWNNLVDNYTPVNYKELKEKEDNTTLADSAACAGGACEVFVL
tara:strand:+ start:4909 stop:7020 length:2112 start_codon:yes stop_codon:yes gene_type:complete